jgi:hypothetical protein
MSPANIILIALDRKREVRWTKRAQARNASLTRPVSFAGLARGRNRLYVLCAIVWSALVDRDHDFESPEDLAEYFTTDEQQAAALSVIKAMINDAFPEKKSVESSSSSPNGLTPSSKSESAEPSTGGN